MSGTPAGSKKAAEANKAKDPDFYKKIGAKGGKASGTGGFFANRELARKAGAKGGRARGKKYKTEKVGDAEFIVYD